jgi:hypothetical protein
MLRHFNYKGKQMQKPGKTFKLSKTTKRMMALMGGPAEGRNQFKRMMIDAELSAAVQPKREKRPSGPQGN